MIGLNKGQGRQMIGMNIGRQGKANEQVERIAGYGQMIGLNKGQSRVYDCVERRAR